MLGREVIFTPGFDKRTSNPATNYGISGGSMTFLVKGDEGAVQFVIGCGWYPESAVSHLLSHYDNDGREIAHSIKPMGYDVGYHSKVPMFEGQEPMGKCNICDPCYYDGSVLMADEWAKEFMIGGTAWLWPKLESEYAERFYPKATGDAS